MRGEIKTKAELALPLPVYGERVGVRGASITLRLAEGPLTRHPSLTLGCRPLPARGERCTVRATKIPPPPRSAARDPPAATAGGRRPSPATAPRRPGRAATPARPRGPTARPDPRRPAGCAPDRRSRSGRRAEGAGGPPRSAGG